MDHETHRFTIDEQSPERSLLSDRRRRAVITVLVDRESSIELHELATAVLDFESGTQSAERTHEVRISLHHIHLPKLDDAGIVEYDPESKTILPAHTDHLAPFLALYETDA